MDTFDCVKSKLDVREYVEKKVPSDIKLKTLEAGRFTGSGNNTQHWRFIMIQRKEDLHKLAQDSTTGKFVANADYAVIIITNPALGYHMIDAGRAVQDMQLAAWNYGVASRLYTGMNKENMRKDFAIPENMDPTVVIAFGYPKKRITGNRKKRQPLYEVAFLDSFGNKFNEAKLS